MTEIKTFSLICMEIILENNLVYIIGHLTIQSANELAEFTEIIQLPMRRVRTL